MREWGDFYEFFVCDAFHDSEDEIRVFTKCENEREVGKKKFCARMYAKMRGKEVCKLSYPSSFIKIYINIAWIEITNDDVESNGASEVLIKNNRNK